MGYIIYHLGLVSLSGKTSSCKILPCFEAARFAYWNAQSLRILTGTSAAMLPRGYQISNRCDDPNCQSRGFGISQDSTIRRLMEYWGGAMACYFPDSMVHGANMGPIWGRQDPGGPHVDPMNFAIWVTLNIGHQWNAAREPDNWFCIVCTKKSFIHLTITILWSRHQYLNYVKSPIDTWQISMCIMICTHECMNKAYAGV